MPVANSDFLSPEIFPGIANPMSSGAPGSAGAMRPSPPAENTSGSPYVGAGSPGPDPAMQSYQPSELLPEGTGNYTSTGAGQGSVHDPHAEAGE